MPDMIKKLTILLTIGLGLNLAIASCQDKKTDKSKDKGEFILHGKYINDLRDYNFNGEEVELFLMLIPNPSPQEVLAGKAFRRIASTRVSEEGEFTFRGVAVPGEPLIYFAGFGDPAGLYFTSVPSWDLMLFASEPGNITMYLYGDSVKLSGTPINEKLSEIFIEDENKIRRSIQDSIYQKDPDSYISQKDIEGHPLMIGHKERMRKRYYTLTKENATNDVGKFLFLGASRFCTEEELQEIISLSKGKISLPD